MRVSPAMLTFFFRYTDSSMYGNTEQPPVKPGRSHLLQNDGMYSMFRPDLTLAGKQATREDAEPLFTIFQAMPIPYVEPEDIANLGVFLASDESRYITGQQIRVDGGSLLKWPNGPGG
jgi:NAD(P)-dependent dehydrogenase (short-subunit alcohol dehydrogenase family)